MIMRFVYQWLEVFVVKFLLLHQLGQIRGFQTNIDQNIKHPVQHYGEFEKSFVHPGEKVELPCQILNPDRNEVTWRHESHTGQKFKISSTNSSYIGRFQLLPNSNLEIYPVTPEDSGYYECRFGTWPPIVTFHHVTVIEPPSVSTEPESGSITVLEGDDVQFGCRPKGNPIPMVIWRKRGSSANIQRPVIGESLISITNVSPSDTGLYACKAQNGYGRPAFAKIELRVLYVPEVRIPSKRVHGGTNAGVTLMCTTSGDPSPKVQWFFGQKLVPLSRRVTSIENDAEYGLHFRKVHETDFGIYTCLAKNSIGFGLGYVELSGAPSPPVVTAWRTSSCDQNNDLRIESKKKRHGTRNVTCNINVTLDWAVESYTPVIDYRLMFRRVRGHSNVDSARNEDKDIMSWTEFSIPANPDTGPIHKKSYLVRNLMSRERYEGALTARNKYGNSHLSPIFYFSTLLRTAHNELNVDELFSSVMSRWKKHGGLGDKGDGSKKIYNQRNSIESSSPSTLECYDSTTHFCITFTAFIQIIIRR